MRELRGAAFRTSAPAPRGGPGCLTVNEVPVIFYLLRFDYNRKILIQIKT